MKDATILEKKVAPFAKRHGLTYEIQEMHGNIYRVRILIPYNPYFDDGEKVFQQYKETKKAASRLKGVKVDGNSWPPDGDKYIYITLPSA